MNKTIWILNHYSRLGSGRHYKFSQNLSKRGYNVKLFAASTIHNSNKNRINDSSKYIEEVEGDISCIYIKARNYIGNGKQRIFNMLDFTRGLMSLSKKFDNEKPDIIIASSVHPLTWISGYRLAKRYNAKFIAETRDLWPETLIAMGKIKENSIPARILYKLEKFIYKKADRLIFTFPGGNDYVQSIGLDSSKVRYINNGIDIEEFNYNKKNYEYKDEDLNDENTFKVLFTGAIGKANAIKNVVRVAEWLEEKKINNIKFYIFGDGPERNELERYIEEHNLKNIKFKGRVEKKYIPSILNKSNLNIFSLEHLPNLFKYGLSPNKMFDYFASGKPIVSNVECGYDMLEKYNCGTTVPGDSVEALAEGVLKFYNMSKEEYNTYCKNALKAAENFDFKILADRLENVTLELDSIDKEA